MRLVPALAVAGLIAASLLLPRPAAACGGFFCNAVTQTPIFQSAERILFAKHGQHVTMHVEVAYEGVPTSFGWMLPLPERPVGPDGQPLPLDKTVELSSQHLFDVLDGRTSARFELDRQLGDSWCAPRAEPQPAADVSGWGPGEADWDGRFAPVFPDVEVLEEAKVGPYDAQLVEAGSADQLFNWLNFNGYFQDPAARPILEEYVEAGYLFVGVKLQSGKDAGDLKPLALTFGENAPCVPLRLTAIAAVDDMPLEAWVLGAGRAVPKNYIHARINDQALRFPGAPDYRKRVTEAVDALAGRAWVTEYAGPTADHRGAILPDAARDTTALEAATSLAAVLAAVSAAGIPRGADFDDIVRDTVARPEGLTGYPYGTCFHDPARSDTGCPEPNDAHATTDDELYGFLDYWADRDADGDVALIVELDTLKARIIEEIVQPLARAEDLLAATDRMTRFFTTLSPSDMTRDPLFAFNPDLPDVQRVHRVTGTVEASSDCRQHVVAEYPDGRTWTFDCPGGECGSDFAVPPVPDAPALMAAEILDETGLPVPFDPSQAAQIDSLLSGATPGTPTLPEGYETVPPRDDPRLDPGRMQAQRGGSAASGSGCTSGGASPSWAVALLALLGLARVRRRRA